MNREVIVTALAREGLPRGAVGHAFIDPLTKDWGRSWIE
jgi:hypothetical protein